MRFYKKLLLCVVLPVAGIIWCQDISAQKVAVKTNLLYDATTTVNLGVEIRLGYRTTLELPFNYNGWTFSQNRKLKHYLIQPEIRNWFCESFNGHFWGIHAHYGVFNIGGVTPFKQIKNNRYEGSLIGGGLSYGYHWILGKRFSLEFTLGAGYAYIDYDRFGQDRCCDRTGGGHKHYIGLTKAGVSLIFMIK